MELSFRVALAVLLLLFVAHRGYYTRKYGGTNSAQIEQKMGKLSSRVTNLFAIAALLATVLYLLRPGWMTWASLPFPLWLRWTGIPIALGYFKK